MTCATGGNRPRRDAVVVHLQQHSTSLVQQLNRPLVAGQTVSIWTEYTTDAISALQIHWRTRYDDKAASWNDCPGKKRIIRTTLELISANVLGFAARIENLDEFELRVRRMIHDLRNHQAGWATALAKRFDRQRRTRSGTHDAAKIPKRRSRSLTLVMAGN